MNCLAVRLSNLNNPGLYRKLGSCIRSSCSTQLYISLLGLFFSELNYFFKPGQYRFTC